MPASWPSAFDARAALLAEESIECCKPDMKVAFTSTAGFSVLFF